MNDTGPSGARLDALTESLRTRGHALWPEAFDPQECEALVAGAAVSAEPRRIALAASWLDRIEALRRGLAPLAAQWRPATSAPFEGDGAARHPAQSGPLEGEGVAKHPPPDVWLTHTDASTDCPVVTSGDGDAGFGLLFIVLLNRAGLDFSGGELVLAEQRPRMQTRPHVVPLAQGGLAVIAAAGRPVQGARGPYRVLMRHGVARVREGRRLALMLGWPLTRDAL
ncbi:2OG-Fe(II) oxygenase [Bordetella genomosp. 5]|uniref:2OG-Fe(II) oxygenase n=1 Tax=Bordetella genomosp. 5 TaxID=1395608 RepID=UPI0020CF5637|nr:2OG-Fe(II) oxygenase [Bordetella genomosp. 5]